MKLLFLSQNVTFLKSRPAAANRSTNLQLLPEYPKFNNPRQELFFNDRLFFTVFERETESFPKYQDANRSLTAAATSRSQAARSSSELMIIGSKFLRANDLLPTSPKTIVFQKFSSGSP